MTRADGLQSLKQRNKCPNSAQKNPTDIHFFDGTIHFDKLSETFLTTATTMTHAQGAYYNYLFDKKKGKQFFLFIEHEVLFYEMPFLHRARRIYFCGATALARPVVAGRVLNFGTKEGGCGFT
jgi:hypothetical protein